MRKLIVLASLLFATNASASGVLVQCISGCPGKAGAGAPLKADTQIADQWWAGPSVGLALFARDGATHQWSSQLAFQMAYGIAWRPSFWSVTQSFLRFDLGVSAGGQFTNNGSPFVIQIAPTLTVLDFIAVGFGPRIALSNSQGVSDAVSGVLFLGIATSFGGP